jgi:hypothetical protein
VIQVFGVCWITLPNIKGIGRAARSTSAWGRGFEQAAAVFNVGWFALQGHGADVGRLSLRCQRVRWLTSGQSRTGIFCRATLQKQPGGVKVRVCSTAKVEAGEVDRRADGSDRSHMSAGDLAPEALTSSPTSPGTGPKVAPAPIPLTATGTPVIVGGEKGRASPASSARLPGHWSSPSQG